jgi:predicted ATP-grasp superfamily ATP-dependent carboligase
VRKRILYSDPEDEPERFLADLESELRSGEYQALIPIGGITTSLLVKHRQRFDGLVGMCLPDARAYSICSNKARTAVAALEQGVPVPTTYLPEEQCLESIASTARFPVLIKPRRSSGGRGIAHACDADSLHRLYPIVEAAYGLPIIQEFVREERRQFSAGFLFNCRSQLRAAFVYEDLRQFPVSGGPATFAVSVDRPDIIECGARFLGKLGWRGVAHIQYLLDPDDGLLKLLEVNPRFWGASPLATHAGVDFPHLLYRLVVNGDVEPVEEYRIGAYFRWLLPADILWLCHADRSLRQGGEFFRFRRPDQCYAICSASDPFPIVGAVL